MDIDAFINTMDGHSSSSGILSEPSTEQCNAEKEEKVTTNNTSLSDTISEMSEISVLVDSNALRIRGKDIGNEEEVAFLRGINLLSSIFNDTCLVFPSAFRRYSDLTDEKSPAVVATHHIDETGWQQAFRTFDQVFTHFFGAGFLTNIDFPQTSVESLLISRLNVLKKTHARVPLALILLVRLEVAAIFSFKDESCAPPDSTPKLRTLLSQLLSNATISDSRNGFGMESFLSAFCIPSAFPVDVNSLLLTPLGLLSFAKRNSLSYDWAALDHAIGSSLLKLETPRARFLTGEDSSSRLSDGAELKQQQAPQREDPASNTEDGAPGQQKKKRKTRKRKVCIDFCCQLFLSLRWPHTS